MGGVAVRDGASGSIKSHYAASGFIASDAGVSDSDVLHRAFFDVAEKTQVCVGGVGVIPMDTNAADGVTLAVVGATEVIILSCWSAHW